jgi:hypothetical protein
MLMLLPILLLSVAVRTRKRQTTDVERIHIYSLLLQNTTHFQDKGTLHNGVSSKIAQEMGVHQRTVQCIWQDGQEGGVNNVVSKKMKNCGRKRIEIIPEVIRGVPLRQRNYARFSTCIRCLKEHGACMVEGKANKTPLQFHQILFDTRKQESSCRV